MPFVDTLTRGTNLALVPEPDNTCDRNAILVYIEGDLENDIGYLYSSSAKKICRMIECGVTFSAQVYYIYRKPRSNYPEVCIYLYQLTPMAANHRPVRKGAPKYRPEPPAPKRITVENDLPVMQQVGESPKRIGLLTRIRRFFLMG